MGDCQFFAFPAVEERAAFGITSGSDPDLVLGCGKPQGDGPLFFFVPVPGGAVRVPVCTEHGGYLARLYSGGGAGHGEVRGEPAHCGTCPAPGVCAGECRLTPGHLRRYRLERLEYTERNGGLMSPAARRELEELRAETGGGTGG